MRKLNTSETVQQLTHFIKASVTKGGFKQVVVAVSGGVDSATSASLAVRALGKDNVHVLFLPYRNWHDQAGSNARELLNQLQIPRHHIYQVDIGEAVDGVLKTLDLSTGTKNADERIRIGNIMARERMVVLFDLAKKLNALVLGTENKSEHYLGYFTRFGDEASDIEPLRGLYKTEVYELAKYLNVPKSIVDVAPTAGLWSGQTDEGEFGFTYKEADEILYGLFEAKLSINELVKQGLNRETIERVQKWVKKIEFKHHLPLVAPPPKSR